MPRISQRHWWFAIGWLLLCASGMLALAAYEGRPALHATPPAQWPSDTTLLRNHNQATVLMFLHPRCPCSRASVEQFLITLKRQNALATLVAYEPDSATPGWRAGEFYDLALAHPQHVRIVADPGGREAARFGATASGTCLVFDPHGQLNFHGGVTISRGHRGPNAGWQALEQQLQHPSTPAVIYPVFGCSLTQTTSRP